MPSAIQVVRRAAADGREMRRVARAAWRATYAGILPGGFVRAVLRRGYARDRLLLGLVDPRRDAFVARRDGRLVGYADAVEHAGGLVELTRIYVAPDAQHAGVGRALLEAVVEAARGRDATRLEAHVEPANEAARAWYRRRGFREVGADTFAVGAWVRPTVVCRRDLGG